MDAQNCYEILGISPNATLSDIKTAYRKLQLRHHPDRTHHLSKADREAGESKSKAANNAYEILADETKRRIYDENVASRERPCARPQPEPPFPRQNPIPDKHFTPFRAFGFRIPDLPLFTACTKGWFVCTLLSPRFARTNSKVTVRASDRAISISTDIQQTWNHCPRIKDLHLVVCTTPENKQVLEIRSYISQVKCIEPGKHRHLNHRCYGGKVTTFRIVIFLNENTNKYTKYWKTYSNFFAWKDILRFSTQNCASATVFTREKPKLDGRGKLKPKTAENMLIDDDDLGPLEIQRTSVSQTWGHNWQDMYCSAALGREADVSGF